MGLSELDIEVKAKVRVLVLSECLVELTTLHFFEIKTTAGRDFHFLR